MRENGLRQEICKGGEIVIASEMKERVVSVERELGELLIRFEEATERLRSGRLPDRELVTYVQRTQDSFDRLTRQLQEVLFAHDPDWEQAEEWSSIQDALQAVERMEQRFADKQRLDQEVSQLIERLLSIRSYQESDDAVLTEVKGRLVELREEWQKGSSQLDMSVWEERLKPYKALSMAIEGLAKGQFDDAQFEPVEDYFPAKLALAVVRNRISFGSVVIEEAVDEEVTVVVVKEEAAEEEVVVEGEVATDKEVGVFKEPVAVQEVVEETTPEVHSVAEGKKQVTAKLKKNSSKNKKIPAPKGTGVSQTPYTVLNLDPNSLLHAPFSHAKKSKNALDILKDYKAPKPKVEKPKENYRKETPTIPTQQTEDLDLGSAGVQSVSVATLTKDCEEMAPSSKVKEQTDPAVSDSQAITHPEETARKDFEEVLEDAPVDELALLNQTFDDLELIVTDPEEKQEKVAESEHLIDGSLKPMPEGVSALATGLLSGDIEQTAESFHHLLCHLIEEDHLSMAYWLASYLEEAYPAEIQIPAWLLRSVLLGRHVRNNSGEMMSQLKQDFEELDQLELEESTENALRFLIAAATMRPALLAPNTQAPMYLSILHPKGQGLDSLYQLCTSIADFGKDFYELDLKALKVVREESHWESMLQDLQTRVEDTFRSFKNLTLVYAPTTKVWRKWLEPEDGIVYQMLNPIRIQDESALEKVKQLAEQYKDPAQVRRKVDYTDRKELGRSSGENITARALTQINNKVQEAISFVTEWVEILEAKPGKSNEFNQRKALDLQAELQAQFNQVEADLNQLLESPQSSLEKAAIHTFRRAVNDIRTLFDPNYPISPKDPNCHELLASRLLLIPEIPLKADWTLQHQQLSEIKGGILGHVRQILSPLEAFQAKLKLRDLEGAGLILTRMEVEGGSEYDLVELKREYDKHLKDCRDTLRNDTQDTLKKIEQSFTFNLLRDNERNEYVDEVYRMQVHVEHTFYFTDKHERLKMIRFEIENKKKIAVERTHQLFLKAGLDEGHPSYSRIHKVLEEGDIHSANEYLYRIQNNLDIPEENEEIDTFKDFFVEKFMALEKYISSTKPHAVVRDVELRKNLGPISLKQVGDTQAKQAAEIMQVWYGVTQRKRGVKAEELRSILQGIGFNVSQISKKQQAKGECFEVTAEQISDQKRCPVSKYGSEANGRYRVYGFTDRKTEDDIVYDIGETVQGPPVIAFYFGQMTEERRRNLARLSRDRRRTFLLIDETLMVYLCGVGGSRLPAMFQCTLPFTYLEPYSVTAGRVPPEMFYGRANELKSIMDATCGFIYGGRQLGKTALLQEAKRRFHDPDEGHVAVWIDLKSEGIGESRLIDEIWDVIAGELSKHGVIKSKNQSTSVDELMSSIINWLEQDEGRRILLLLDEADRFLDIDARVERSSNEEPDSGRTGFSRCSRIKGLMDRTQRRFKVVFAGLHNVQRTIRNENDPLAHYGEPICIGPLLSNDEWTQARDLIEKPMASIGYYFESKDLVTRILSQTNYYPLLIQLYCRQLLKHMNEHRVAASFDPKACPPYLITSRHVDEAYQDRDLQETIKHRFLNLTLRLDSRYEVIAYAIAHALLENQAEASEGFSTSWIREDVIGWWEDGFKNCPTDSFRILLEEMCGLGVLRMVRDGRYTLRSTNLLSLMGSQEEIEDVLLGVDRQIVNEYEPSSFRAALTTTGKEAYLRSPLTAEQEFELNKPENTVAVIFGNDAADRNHLNKFLGTFYEKRSVKVLRLSDQVTQVSDFVRILEKEVDEKKSDQMMIVLVHSCPWTEEWTEAAKEFLIQNRAQKMKVVFVADPEQTWRLLADTPNLIEKWPQHKIVLFQLTHWQHFALGQWMLDCDLGSGKQHFDKIRELTGNWPSLLYRLYGLTKSSPHNLSQHLVELEARLGQSELLDELLQEFGLTKPEILTVFQALLLDEKIGRRELIEFCDKLEEQTIEHCLKWGELMSLLQSRGDDMWTLDPMVAHLLRSLEL